MDVIEKLSLKQIRYFVAVAETGSFRQAAFQLNITQPTLSNQISALEKLLGMPLLERSRHGTRTTVAGREMVGNARRILEEARGLTVKAGNFLGGGVGTHRLGVTPTLGPYLLPHILTPLHSNFHDLKLYVREETPSVLELGLVQGLYDLALSTQPISSSELEVVPICREPIKLVLSNEHRLAKKERIKRADLVSEPILTISEHHLFHRQIIDLCQQLGAQVRRDYEGTSLDTLRQMVVMGMGSAFLPALYIKSEIRDDEELRVVDVEGVKVVRNHALAWRHTSPDKLFYRELANQVREIIQRTLSPTVTPILPND